MEGEDEDDGEGDVEGKALVQSSICCSGWAEAHGQTAGSRGPDLRVGVCSPEAIVQLPECWVQDYDKE